MLLYALILMGVVALFMFIHKLVMKSRMQKQLGRKVHDRELTSLTSWMQDGKSSKDEAK